MEIFRPVKVKDNGFLEIKCDVNKVYLTNVVG